MKEHATLTEQLEELFSKLRRIKAILNDLDRKVDHLIEREPPYKSYDSYGFHLGDDEE